MDGFAFRGPMMITKKDYTRLLIMIYNSTIRNFKQAVGMVSGKGVEMKDVTQSKIHSMLLLEGFITGLLHVDISISVHALVVTFPFVLVVIFVSLSIRR